MSRPESRFSVRPARPSDGSGLRLLARELAHGPLLSRYAADPARLGAELSALADSDHRTETLLIAEETASHTESAESAESVKATESGARLCALARFSHSGMFGRLGGYLQLIAVAPSHQGQGVGSLLLSHVEQTVGAHSRDLFLLASHFNDAAHRFYARHGYREVGQLPAYVRPDITEHIFWKRLRSP